MSAIWCDSCFAMHQLRPADIERIVYTLQIDLHRAWRDPFYLRPDRRCLRETLARSRDAEHKDVNDQVRERRREARMDGVLKRLGFDGVEDPSLAVSAAP